MAKHTPASRFAKVDDNALLARRAAIIDRMGQSSKAVGDHVKMWSRYDDDVHEQRSGAIVNHAAGRAIGRLKDDGRILDEIDTELSERGYTEAEVASEYDQHYAQQEREALARASGDDSFNVSPDGELAPPIARPVPVRPMRGKRDKLAWVPIMQRLAAQYKLAGL